MTRWRTRTRRLFSLYTWTDKNPRITNHPKRKNRWNLCSQFFPMLTRGRLVLPRTDSTYFLFLTFLFAHKNKIMKDHASIHPGSRTKYSDVSGKQKMLITTIVWTYSRGLCIYLSFLSIFWTQSKFLLHKFLMVERNLRRIQFGLCPELSIENKKYKCFLRGGLFRANLEWLCFGRSNRFLIIEYDCSHVKFPTSLN